ncbi:phospholipase [Ottowia sp.]|uniref:phospholipase n=1 Tax=Ottowia sp. TaxID=1898956 RepID=UPI003A859FC0
MPALNIYAGSLARRHIEQHGLRPADVGVIPAAAGGPKGLILGPLDRFVFGQWLVRSAQPVDLVGASIGAWRMAAACMADPVAAFQALEIGYIHGDMTAPPGRKLPAPAQVSAAFAQNLRTMFEGQVPALLAHRRYRLHVLASRGRHVLLGRERWARTAVGYLGAALTNAVSRRAMGHWLERVVFSRADTAGQPAPLPFATQDYLTRQVLLTAENFYLALQASGSIPFVLQAVHDIAGAPPGAYWDGGITDYHLHLHYTTSKKSPLVLYPHFQQAVVPGWLDKPWRRRHRATAALDAMLLLAPSPDWVRTLPGGKLPDRTDFQRLSHPERVLAWASAVSAAQQLADEFADWLVRPDLARVQVL